MVTWGYLVNHPNFLYASSLGGARMGQHEGAGDPQIARIQPLAHVDRLEAALTISRILTPGADLHLGLGAAPSVRVLC